MAQTMVPATLFLNPGEVFWGGHDQCVRTLLGSCVSLTLWHRARQLGVICHYLLPFTPAGSKPDGRYADAAVELMVNRIRRSGTRVQDYEGKIFGGGNMFSHTLLAGSRMANTVGDKNVQAGRNLLAAIGVPLVAEDVGGNGHRTIIFDIGSGAVWVRRQSLSDAAAG